MENPSRRQAKHGFEQMSFLPPLDFNPIWPTPNTLPARCLSLMLDGKTFTHPEFEASTGSWRLSAVVFTLIELGWPIASWYISAPTDEAPGRTISRYYLPENIIRETFGSTK